MEDRSLAVENKIQKFIYGAGKYGELLFDFLAEYMDIDYFVQTDASEAKEIKGIPVISFGQMVNLGSRKIVLIAINSIKIAREIEKNIYFADETQTKVYYLGSFITDNLLKKKTFHLTGEKHCLICDSYFDGFLPAGIDTEIFRKHNIIGGGVSGELCMSMLQKWRQGTMAILCSKE